MRPTGGPGASGKRREASERAGGRPPAIALGKGVEQGLHTRTTTYLALAVTSMPSMLAVVVKRAERCCCVVWAGKAGGAC